MSLPNHYPIETMVTLTAAFTLPGTTTPVDPSQVYLYYLPPNGTIQEWEYLIEGNIVRDDVGQYHADILGSSSGTWLYKWQGSGTVEVTSQDTRFFVDPSTLIAG